MKRLQFGALDSERVVQRRRQLGVLAAAAVMFAVVPGVALGMIFKPAHHSRALGECIRDLAGNGQYGGLTNDTEFFLSLQSINLSDWTGNHDYFARRYDSGFNQTYIQLEFVDSGAPQEWSYGTAGNANRRTTIETGNSQGLPQWSEFESGIC
jgi:hypothetical protein